MKATMLAPIAFALIAGCTTTQPIVDPALQAQTISQVAGLFEKACIQNTGQLAQARTVLNAHGFDNRETAGTALLYYNNEDDLVAALVPFSYSQTLGGQTQSETRGIQCSVGSSIYRIDEGAALIKRMAEKYIPDGLSERLPRQEGGEFYSIAIAPQVFGKSATWDSFIEVIVADEETREDLQRTNPDAPIFAFIAGVGVTEIQTIEAQ